MEKLKSDNAMRMEQANGSYYALNLAQSHLENRMKSLQTKYLKDLEEQKNLTVSKIFIY